MDRGHEDRVADEGCAHEYRHDAARQQITTNEHASGAMRDRPRSRSAIGWLYARVTMLMPTIAVVASR